MLLRLRTQCAEAPVIFIASDLCFLSDAQHHRADAEMEKMKANANDIVSNAADTFGNEWEQYYHELESEEEDNKFGAFIPLEDNNHHYDESTRYEGENGKQKGGVVGTSIIRFAFDGLIGELQYIANSAATIVPTHVDVQEIKKH